MKMATQILGMILLVGGGQGAIRLAVHHEDAGFLSWIGGGWVVQLAVYAIAVVVGITLAVWATRKSRTAEPEEPTAEKA